MGNGSQVMKPQKPDGKAAGAQLPKASRILEGYKEKLSKLKSGQKLSADADGAKVVQENVTHKLAKTYSWI